MKMFSSKEDESSMDTKIAVIWLLVCYGSNGLVTLEVHSISQKGQLSCEIFGTYM